VISFLWNDKEEEDPFILLGLILSTTFGVIFIAQGKLYNLFVDKTLINLNRILHHFNMKFNQNTQQIEMNEKLPPEFTKKFGDFKSRFMKI
jgi:hypothetical protein